MTTSKVGAAGVSDITAALTSLETFDSSRHHPRTCRRHCHATPRTTTTTAAAAAAATTILALRFSLDARRLARPSVIRVRRALSICRRQAPSRVLRGVRAADRIGSCGLGSTLIL